MVGGPERGESWAVWILNPLATKAYDVGLLSVRGRGGLRFWGVDVLIGAGFMLLVEFDLQGRIRNVGEWIFGGVCMGSVHLFDMKPCQFGRSVINCTERMKCRGNPSSKGRGHF